MSNNEYRRVVSLSEAQASRPEGRRYNLHEPEASLNLFKQTEFDVGRWTLISFSFDQIGRFQARRGDYTRLKYGTDAENRGFDYCQPV